MKTINILIVSVLLVAIFTSCSIEKRLYRPGFYVETTSHRKLKQQQDLGIYTNAAVQNNIMAQEERKSTFTHENAYSSVTFHDHDVNIPKKTVLAQNHVNNSSQSHYLAVSTSYKQQIVSIIQENKAIWNTYKGKSLARGGDSQIVALLLCFFLGVFGIHSFYLGNKKKGTIQLVMLIGGVITSIIFIGIFVLVALAIWVFVDFIRILIGDLGPGW